MNSLSSLLRTIAITALTGATFICSNPAWTQTEPLNKPIPWQQLTTKLHPSRHRPDLMARAAADQARMKAAQQAGTLQTLPYWQGSFSIEGKDYHYTILGGDPTLGGTTTIPTVIVPIRLTISDFSEDGKTPVVLDATPIVKEILNSPIFAKSDYITGSSQQFTDAMLLAEFPQAASKWHTVFSPTVYSTVDIAVPKGSAKVYQSKSGKLLAVIRYDRVIDDPIFTMIGNGTFPPTQNTIFVTYNALEHDAFGYHSAVYLDQKTEEVVFSYNSWLDDVDDLFTIPSPDAATLSHEIAETVHDAFNGNLSSRTLLWGDPFFHNQCFQDYIEVGDAVEDAPAAIQLHEQVVGFDKHARVYTLQNEATLQWFERKDPSDALAGTYSFPDIWVLTKPAPLTCKN
jgi:chitinase